MRVRAIPTKRVYWLTDVGYTILCSTVLSHGHSQLKHQNLRVGSYVKNLLKWFNYPHARAHPGYEVSCHGTEWTCIVGSSVIRWGQPDSGESCIMLQSGPTRSLVAKFPQHSVVACSTQISCCRGRMLQKRPWTGVCEPLMPDVVTYLRIHYVRILAYGGWLHREPWKTTKLSKLEVGCLHGYIWAFTQDNTVHVQLVRKRKGLHI